jgi:hypothetical protein
MDCVAAFLECSAAAATSRHRSTTELGTADDKGVFPQPSLLQVFYHGGERLV